MLFRSLWVLSFLLLAGCASQAPNTVKPAVVAARPGDPQRCIERADCTTKVSRTLLFVFDYAAAGGQLVQRQDRLLFTPADAPPSDWPAIYIRLAEPADSRFDFNAECRSARCRYDAQQLLRVYRSYLAGAPCSLLLGAAIESCTAR
ncbi:hypothetical protein [Aquipseudomonas alcaligenes]|uniref:Lipoprotein n=2 Tax=Aquipseudomonas alcaligenes TaxID=43263 RepID=U2YZD1_AQUA1|nr:hypothetical protein [Pseudomonas alcaligenes]MDH0142650.1 hypothetical protein [Pseudomonas alcaligenes]GAD60866.1 hypothetical protein PA6_002_01090 [Pseudomonas alcaligenes NBRC 14159]SUD13615.1 Uncharacterised protein [Pseudomonas alcaligenes]